MRFAIGSSKVDELVDIILNPRFSQNRVRNQSRSHVADRQPARAGLAIDVIRRFSSASAGHVLAHNRRISWDKFLEIRDHRGHAHRSRPPGLPSLNDGDRLALIKRGWLRCGGRDKSDYRRQAEDKLK